MRSTEEIRDEIQRATREGLNKVAALETELQEARVAERKASQERAAQERREHRVRMYQEHVVPFSEMPQEIGDKIYALAWEYGHDSGFSEVENHYGDFAQLAIEAYAAGRENKN